MMTLDIVCVEEIAQRIQDGGSWTDDALNVVKEGLQHRLNMVWGVVVAPTQRISIEHERVFALALDTLQIVELGIDVTETPDFQGVSQDVIDFCNEVTPWLLCFLKAIEERLDGSPYKAQFLTEANGLIDRIRITVAAHRFATNAGSSALQ